MSDTTVTISREDFERLLQSDLFLDCLLTIGVDEWYGYEDARDMFTPLWDEQLRQL